MEGLFLTGLFFGWLIAYFYFESKRFEGRRIAQQYDLSDASNQKRFIEDVDLFVKNPINKEAYRYGLVPCEQAISQVNDGHRLLAEVALGSFIRTKRGSSNGKREKRAFSSYNSKRLDFLIIDKRGKPVLAVEYQGTGHDLDNTAAQRDEVKRLALEQAGVMLYEIPEKDAPIKTRDALVACLGQSC